VFRFYEEVNRITVLEAGCNKTVPESGWFIKTNWFKPFGLNHGFFGF